MRRSMLFLAAAALLACHSSDTQPAVAPGPATPAPAPVTAASATPGASDLDARRATLRALVDEAWEYSLKTSPITASIYGDRRYNDQWDDLSEAAALADVEHAKAISARLAAIDVTGFPEQERLDQALLARQLALTVEGARFQPWLMPVNQFAGLHVLLAQVPSLISFESVKDYDDYVTRLRAVPTLLDAMIANMRKGMKKGDMPPRFLMGKIVEQSEAIATPKPEDSPFAQPFKTFPDAVPEAERARLRAAGLAAVAERISPAYRAFAAFVKTEYAPHGRTSPGIWGLPDGDARYAFAVKSTTTTNLSPAEIHDLGLREVARIEAEALKVAKSLGFSDLRALQKSIDRNPALHFASRDAILERYRKHLDAMSQRLPELFGRLPKAKLEVRPVEEFQEATFSAARYDQGTPDGSRPGHVMVNTGDFKHRTWLSLESTAYHEGVPGHHLQISIAQEVPDLPPFRQHYEVTAFIEGWALYSERLGEEVGFYQDPYSMLGHLNDEMLRAIRLVADTGLHAKHWTRKQVVDFFHAHSTLDEVEVQTETDRYMVLPSQALGYKVGQLKILELREHARKELGDRFDIRGFHDTVLDAGALPLDVLEQQVEGWIRKRRAG